MIKRLCWWILGVVDAIILLGAIGPYSVQKLLIDAIYRAIAK